MTSGIVDQDLPHQARSQSDKMNAVLCGEGLLFGETQVRFVDKCSALQGVFRALSLQVAMRNLPQLLINQRDQSR
jgi:hypothetical protein